MIFHLRNYPAETEKWLNDNIKRQFWSVRYLPPLHIYELIICGTQNRTLFKLVWESNLDYSEVIR